jgi:glycosyltransferase involved in cell wall biosynthesis
MLSFEKQEGDKISNNAPKISVVMPLFNQVKFIERSISSVLAQNYPNLELIIIDGGSTDGSTEIVNKFKEHISYWTSEPDNGQSHALNKGFKCAHGDIYGWLNSDDLYAEGAFSKAVETFLKNPDKDVVFGDHDVIDENDKLVEHVYSFDFNIRHFVYEGFHLNAQACFWRSSLHKQFGEFDENLHRTMDYDMLLRFGCIAGAKRFKRVDQTLGCFRRHTAQKTQGFDGKVKAEHVMIASKNHYPLKNGSLYPLLRFIYRFRRLYWYLKRGGLAYTTNKVCGSL